jgi:hypothetical protein
VRGGLGFISPCIQLESTGAHFVPVDFCRQFLDFIGVSALFYERASRYYGPCVLDVNVVIPEAKLFPGFPTANDQIQGDDLFTPPLNVIRVNAGTQIDFSLFPISPDHLRDYLEAVLIDMVRPSGSVLDSRFHTAVQPLVEESVRRLSAARMNGLA